MMVKLNIPMLDWITLTSYDGWLARAGTKMLADMPEPFARKIICYDGLASDGEDGGLFVGTGEQAGRYHCMLQLSGALADKVAPKLVGAMDMEMGNCSRIDLQITVAEEVNLKLLSEQMVGKVASQVTLYSTLQGSQVGDTLYIGSPRSDKRIRMYHKAGGTRFEIQYRRDYASSVASRIAETGSMTVRQVVAGFLLNELQKLDRSLLCEDVSLWGIENKLVEWANGVLVPTSNARAVGNTELWLRKSVFPCLVKECNRNPRLKRELLAKLHGCSTDTGEIIE